MRYLSFILSIVFLCNSSFAQTSECQLGIDSAKVDFKNGILRTYLFGLTDSFTYGKILKDTYGVEAIYMGCIVEEKWDCYSTYMDSQIREKYGNDIFEKIYRSAHQLDSLGKGDRQASFPYGEEALMKFVYRNLDLVKAKYSPNKKGIVFLSFTVDTDGKPIDIKILKTPNKDFSNEAIRLINKMPKWVSATRNGECVSQYWNLPIVFDRKRKEKYCP